MTEQPSIAPEQNNGEPRDLDHGHRHSGSGSDSHNHSHSYSHAPVRVQLSLRAKLATFGILFLVAASTVIGMITLWPNADAVSEIAQRADLRIPGTVIVEGEILSLSDECDAATDQSSAAGACIVANIGIRSGEDAGRLIRLQLHGGLAGSGLIAGDRVELSGYPVSPEIIDQSVDRPSAEDSSGEMIYNVTGIHRHIPLLILAIAFIATVVIVGRMRGALAILALGVSAAILLLFVLPALVAGGPGLLIGMVGASAIMFATLYFVHGFNMRTTAALIGTLCGILIISGISSVAVAITRLSGVGDETSGLLSAMVTEIDFRGLLSCSILIAGLGVLNDVTITQASSVWELRAAAPGLSRREVYQRAMRIGRDHIASTVYTVFFAYAGAAISVLLLLYLLDRPVLSLLSGEDIAIEIVRTLCGSIGLVLAVPITTGVAAMFIPEGVSASAASPRSQG